MAIYSFIAEEQANQVWKVAEMCRVLEVSRSGFYDWQNREPSARELTDRMLAVEIEAIWECSDRSYGVPRMHRWLVKQGFEVGRNRVARIMRANGWEGWSVAAHMRTELVADALTMAVATRNGEDVAGVVFHSDRGSQYTSAEFGDLCDRHGILQSMGATGVCPFTGQSDLALAA